MLTKYLDFGILFRIFVGESLEFLEFGESLVPRHGVSSTLCLSPL